MDPLDPAWGDNNQNKMDSRERETEGKNNNHVRQDRVNQGTVAYLKCVICFLMSEV